MVASIATQHERTFAEIKRLCSAGLEGTELLARVAKGLRRVVPFAAYCASTMDPATNLITRGIADGMGDGRGSGRGNVFFDRIYFEEGIDKIASMLREKRATELLSEATGGKLERSLRFRELLEPLGFGHEMSGAFVDGSLWGGMDLIRGAGDEDFTTREVQLFRRVAPHVGAGLKAAALHSKAIAEHGGPDIPGVLTLDRQGRVISHTPAARRWLEDLEDLHPDLARERSSRTGQDGGRRPKTGHGSRLRQGYGPRPEGASKGTLGPLAHALRLPHRVQGRSPR